MKALILEARMYLADRLLALAVAFAPKEHPDTTALLTALSQYLQAATQRHEQEAQKQTQE